MKDINLNFTELNCAICKSSIKNLPSIVPEINPMSDVKIKKKNWSNLKKIVNKRTFFPYHRCKCGLLTNKNFLNQSSLKYLYSDMKENIHTNDTELNDLKTKLGYLGQIKNILNSKKNDLNILEIGADNGSFQKLLAERISNAKLSVIEPNKRMHKKLKKNCDFIYSDITKLPRNKKFDMIIAIHVFDHVPNFIDFLKTLKSKLKSEGQIYGVVHNEKSLMAKILKNKWPAYCLQHPHLFNENSLDLAFQKLKFKKIFIKRTINFFNLGFLLQHLFVAFFKVKIKFPSFFPLGLKLGNFSFLYIK